MNRNEFEDHVAACRKELEWLVKYDRGCKGCSHFDGGTCKRFNAQPPAEFLPQGCDHWDYDEVPF